MIMVSDDDDDDDEDDDDKDDDDYVGRCPVESYLKVIRL